MWVYMLSFTFCVFFSLVNFFLAIVVEGYTRVRAAVEDNEAENSIVMDLWDVMRGMMKQRQHTWPSPAALLRHILQNQGIAEVDVSNNALTLKQCLELKDDLPVVTATELADPKTALGLSLEQAQLYVSHYTARLKNLKAVADEAPWGVQNQVQEQDAKICDLQARLAVQEALLVKVLEAVQGIQAWTTTLPSESKYEPSWNQGGFPAGEASMPVFTSW